MKISNSFTQKVNDFLRRLRGHRNSDKINPARDWLTGLALACLTLLLGIIYIALDFFAVTNSTTPSVMDVQQIQYNEKGVRAFYEIYVEREKAFDTLRSERRYIPPITLSSTSPDSASTTPPEGTLADDPIEQ